MGERERELVRQRCVRTMAITRRQGSSEAKVKEVPGAAGANAAPVAAASPTTKVSARA